CAFLRKWARIYDFADRSGSLMRAPVIQRLITMSAGLVVAAAISAGLALLSHGVQARTPGRWETRIMTLVKHRLLVGGKDKRNPLPATPESIVEGQHDFSH